MEKIPEMSWIVDSLTRLNDSNLLTKSREYSNYYDLSIARWAQKRAYLVFKNSSTGVCAAGRLEEPHTGREPEQLVPAIAREALLKCLTLSDVQELAKFELPLFSDAAQSTGRIQRDIELNPGSLPRDLRAASVFVNALLFFVVMYFCAFAREAIASKGFPATGTLFCAFSRSRWTLLVLLAALWSPPFASSWVTIVSREWWLGTCSLMILWGVCSVHLVLQQKSYFSALSPRKWMTRTTSGTSVPSAHEEQYPGQSKQSPTGPNSEMGQPAAHSNE